MLLPHELLMSGLNRCTSHLKVAKHECETWYACEFQNFHNHQQKITSGTFSITTFLLLKLANYVMHVGETLYAFGGCHRNQLIAMRIK